MKFLFSKDPAPAALATLNVEYVWVCSDAPTDIRSKIRVIKFDPHTDAKTKAKTDQYRHVELSDIPEWNFDGSSTGQAKGADTEIILKPVRLFDTHPFATEQVHPSVVVLCECYLPNGTPAAENTRHLARTVFDHARAAGLAPWFGLEQEYVLTKGGRPLGWPEDGSEPEAQGPFYCGTGTARAHGRRYAMQHLAACQRMGLAMSGLNAEVMPGQWEYQVGPCEGIASGDEVVMARWALMRCTEAGGEGVDVTFACKPKKGDWNGSGLHTNFSTAPMRVAPTGAAAIEQVIARLGTTVAKDIVFYGRNNNERLTGKHETSRLDQFSHGVGTRTTSIRIPNQVAKDQCGYFEDRRPASDADPYLVTARLFASSYDIPAPALDEASSRFCEPWMKDLAASAAASNH